MDKARLSKTSTKMQEEFYIPQLHIIIIIIIHPQSHTDTLLYPEIQLKLCTL